MFFVWPVVAILGRGLVPRWSRSTSTRSATSLTDPALRHVAWFTVWQADAVDRADAGGRRCPGAYVLARYEFPGRRVVRALVTVPFVLPTVVVGAAFVALLGAGGPLGVPRPRPDRRRDPGRALFFNYAVVVRTVGGLWSHLDPRPEEAARMLGASRLRTFRG